MECVRKVCFVVAFEGRASFPLWARPGQPTAPRRRRNAQGQLLLERGICSFSQVLNFWYAAVREAIQKAGAIAWDQVDAPGEVPTPAKPCSGGPDSPPVVYWSYYAQNHWRRALRKILDLASSWSSEEQATRLSFEGQGLSLERQGTGFSSEGQTTGGHPGAHSGLAEGKESSFAEQPQRPEIAPSSGSEAFWGKEGGASGGGRLVLLGFSNGGDAVYQTATALERRGIRVDLAITVDPVRKPLRGMGFMGFRRPRNVVRWINYYQRFDRRTLAGLLPIVGRHVDGADENIQMQPEDFPDPTTRPKAHLWIPSLEVVRRRITEELAGLLLGQAGR